MPHFLKNGKESLLSKSLLPQEIKENGRKALAHQDSGLNLQGGAINHALAMSVVIVQSTENDAA